MSEPGVLAGGGEGKGEGERVGPVKQAVYRAPTFPLRA